MIRLTRTVALLCAPIVSALLLAACGGSDVAAEEGVASLNDDGDTASEAEATESASSNEEEAILEYVECLRGEGIDVPDPQVDADGNLTMRFGGPGGGDEREPSDPEEMEAAREVCGDPPRLGGGDVDPERQAEFQDAALRFAQCMRDRGYDVPDPDFQGEGGVMFRGGAGLDADDPEQQAAAEECQEESFGNLRPNVDRAAEPGGNGS